jgi:hypothetical protein
MFVFVKSDAKIKKRLDTKDTRLETANLYKEETLICKSKPEFPY